MAEIVKKYHRKDENTSYDSLYFASFNYLKKVLDINILAEIFRITTSSFPHQRETNIFFLKADIRSYQFPIQKERYTNYVCFQELGESSCLVVPEITDRVKNEAAFNVV